MIQTISQQNVATTDNGARSAPLIPETAPSTCCLAPRRLRVHHVLDDYGAQARITTRRWVICGQCGEVQ